MQITDFDNGIKKIQESDNKVRYELAKKIELIKENIVVEYNQTEYFIYETAGQYSKIFQSDYFTDILINFDADDNNEEDFALEVLSAFISYYRSATSNFWILELNDLVTGNIVVKTAFHEYSPDEKRINVQDRLRQTRKLSFGLKQAQFRHDSINMNFSEPEIIKHGELLSNKIASGSKTEFYHESILRAQQQFIIFKNYKYSFLELFFAIESFVVEFLEKEKAKYGVSNNKIKEYRGEVGISYQINIELPLVLKEISEKERQVIGKIDAMRRKRNEIVHNGGTVNKKDVADALEATIEFINMMKKRGA